MTFQTPPQKSIAEQAKEKRDKEAIEKIDKLATQLSHYIRHEIWEANLPITYYKPIMEAVANKTAEWFNGQINARNMQDVLDDPTPSDKNK